jgi:hypothetical protein
MKAEGVLKGSPRYLLHAIALIQGKNDAAWCGNQYLQDLTGMSHCTFESSLHKLVALGLIVRFRRDKRQRTAINETKVDAWMRNGAVSLAHPAKPSSHDRRLGATATEDCFEVEHEDVSEFDDEDQAQGLSRQTCGAGDCKEDRSQENESVLPDTDELTDDDKLMGTTLFDYLGRPAHLKKQVGQWAQTLSTLRKRHDLHAFDVLRALFWAYEIDDFWPPRIAKQADPVRYLSTKLLTIYHQSEADRQVNPSSGPKSPQAETIALQQRIYSVEYDARNWGYQFRPSELSALENAMYAKYFDEDFKAAKQLVKDWEISKRPPRTYGELDDEIL